LHAHVAAAAPNLRHVEWFIDHARLEPLLVDGVPIAAKGQLQPDDATPGHGMTIGAPAAEYRVAPPPEQDNFGTPAELPIGGSP